MIKQVTTEVWTLQTISQNNIAFVIPSYQRPYVWHDDEVLKLFDDIVAAFKNNDSHYFIGTVLTAQNNHSEGLVYELVDGQQRTTTLMLMSLAFKDKGILVQSLGNIATLNNQPRLTFAIREQVQALLGYWAGLKKYSKPSEKELDENPFLIRIYGALKVLKDRLAQYEVNELEKIAKYIFEKVQWVNNLMPPKMDVNRLFATANTTGIQLAQTDILKAFLLKNIKTDKARYEAIWQACEQMDNYFERNVKQIFTASDWKAIQPETLATFDSNIFLLVSKIAEQDNLKSGADFSIASLAKNSQLMADQKLDNKQENTPPSNIDDEEEIYCRSIISFPLLLLHTYRIFLSQKLEEDIDGKFHPDRLIKIFEPLLKKTEDEIKAFFECLWQVRYQFDRCVIKWSKRSEEKEEYLIIKKMEFYKTSNTIQRTPKKRNNLTALQSVCYFTSERSTQYWLTPLLGWLIEQSQTSTQEVLYYLEQIDNQLSLIQMTQKEASFVLLTKNLPQQSLDNQITYLLDPKGTGFEHYWFQKLEYLLWKHRGDYLKEIDSVKLEKYRITSKNSVEHVHPQNEEHGRKLPDKFLHAFGNLALLNVIQNASYGNKSVDEKEAKFSNRPSYDSLKLAHIFLTKKKSGKWGETDIKKHQEDMLDLLKKHYLNELSHKE